MFSFEVIAGFVVVVLVIFIVAGVLLTVRLGKAKARLWAGQASLRSGNLAPAVEAFREAAMTTVGSKDFFKLHGGQRDTFDQARAGLLTAYQQAGLAVDLQPLMELHAHIVRLSEREGAGLMEGSANELAQLRQQGVNLLARLPKLPAGARPRAATGPGAAPIATAQPMSAAPLPLNAPPAGATAQPGRLHWNCPHWFELQLAGDAPQRLGFSALIGLAVTMLIAAPAVGSIPAAKFFALGIPWLLFSLAIGLLAAFITAQRIWPGKTEVECEPTALVKKVSRSMIGVNGVTTQWLDTTWPYTSIQFCGIRPPGDGQPFGLLVVGSDGEFDVLAVPADYPLRSLVEFLTARGVQMQRITAVKREWLPTWQSPVKWIAGGIAAGVGALAMLVAMMIPKQEPPPQNPPLAAPPAIPALAPNPAPSPPPAPAVPGLALRRTWSPQTTEKFRGAAFSADVASCTFWTYSPTGGSVQIASGDQPFRALEKLFADPEWAVFSPDGSRLYYTNTAGDLAVIEAATGRALDQLKMERPQRVAISHSGRLLAAISPSKLELINLQNPQQRKTLPLGKSGFGFLAFAPNDGELLTWNSQTLWGINCATGEHREIWNAPPEYQSKQLHITDDSRWLTFVREKKVLILSLESPVNPRIVAIPDSVIYPVLPRKQGQELIYFSLGKLWLWDTNSGKVIATAPQPGPAELRLSADEKFIAAREALGTTVNVWQLP